jgi:Ni2+-binding GTPase involved in maturation of urease and hydrogenase
MIIHLVGGFLGSGKTTAILEASRLLIRRGVSVGVVTNDQGRNLVDTAFLQSSGIKTMEVTGGCFCCNLPDFRRKLEELQEAAAPQVVFAEPVGSCTDLVATVMKPLAEGQGPSRKLGSLSVLTDIRLIRQRLEGRPLPFSSEVQYIFDTQMEEADILVLNKEDLMAPEAANDVLANTQDRFPGKQVILHSARNPKSVESWLVEIQAQRGLLPRSVPVDYDLYAKGENRLAWYDAVIVVEVPNGDGRGAVQRIVDSLGQAVVGRNRPTGHVKLLVRHQDSVFKCSITSAGEEKPEIPMVQGERLSITLNARTEDGAMDLRAALREAFAQALTSTSITWQVVEEDAFHPSKPVPYKRII